MRWLTFIGGRYTPQKFIAEASKIGVSRRIPRTSKVEFGDTVILARYGSPVYSFAFGEFRVSRLTLEQGTAEQVKVKLFEQGHTVYEGGGDPISMKRECGEYTVSSRSSTDAALQEIKEIIKEIDPNAMIMIGGPLVRTFYSPLIPAPKFSRGLRKCSYDFSQAPIWDGISELMGIEEYTKY